MHSAIALQHHIWRFPTKEFVKPWTTSSKVLDQSGSAAWMDVIPTSLKTKLIWQFSPSMQKSSIIKQLRRFKRPYQIIVIITWPVSSQKKTEKYFRMHGDCQARFGLLQHYEIKVTLSSISCKPTPANSLKMHVLTRVHRVEISIFIFFLICSVLCVMGGQPATVTN